MGLFTSIKKALSGGSGTDFKQMLDEGAIVVDVRTPGEFKGGHVKGSVNVNLSDLNKKMGQFKGKTVITVCASGMRSGQAKGILVKNGITAVNGGPWGRIAKLKS
jgi:rhodanese-related sulfurtransferase